MELIYSRDKIINLIEKALRTYGSLRPGEVIDYVSKNLTNTKTPRTVILAIIKDMIENGIILESMQGELELNKGRLR